jgi:formylglycine-generating enzyme required for sulfatase activity
MFHPQKNYTAPALTLILSIAGLANSCFAVQQGKAIGVRQALKKLPGNIDQVPDRHAIIIGVGDFEANRNTDRKDDIPSLPQCDTDAEVLYSVLTDPGKGMFEKENVVILTGSDATKDRIMEELDELSNRIDKDDLVVVYFSGHGATDSKGRAFWVTYDTEIDRLFATGLSQLMITDMVKRLIASRVVTIIDACYAASTANLASSSKAPLINVKELYTDFSGKGRVIIAASDGSEQSMVITKPDHPGNGQSVFSWHLSQGLSGAADANQDGVITVDEIWDHVKGRTSATARKLRGKQTPTIKSDMVGRFLFSVNADVLVGNYEKRINREQQLRTFALDEQITVEQYREAASLLGKDPTELNRESRERREIYLQVADGELTVSRVTRALALVKPMVVAKPKPKPERSPPAVKYRPPPTVVKKREPAKKQAQLGVAQYNTLGMKLTGIPAGDFLMGSYESAEQVARAFLREQPNTFYNEHPLRRVMINRGFFMGTTEVTVGQFRAFVNATGYRTQKEKGEMGGAATSVKFDDSSTWRSPVGQPANDRHPVAVVTYNDAVAFCQWLSRKEGKTYRLPTDAEWEYAARAGTKTRFWNGNSIRKLTEVANIPDASHFRVSSTIKADELGYAYSDGDDGFASFAPVGSFRANPWGLHDVHGNVWEWCTVADLSSLRLNDTYNVAVIRGGCFY